ncbi:MAG TPA: PEGA domain-containing protein [Methanocella sp.]|nr:PEGA domain-containing protein [Methanocella sp.]
MPVSLADNASYGAVKGKVIDRNGNPLGNATVEVQNYVGDVIATITSASDGTFTYSNVPITGFDGRNTFRLVATYGVNNKTYTDKTEFFWVYKNQVIEHNVQIYYYPPSNQGWLTGKVVNLNNLNQYLSATIYLSNGMYYFVTSEPGDHFQFYLPEGDYQVWAEHNENGRTYASGKSDVHVRSDDTTSAVLTVSLAGNGTAYHAPPAAGINVVHGSIVQKNNAPLYGAQVELCRLTGSSLDPLMSTTSNADGSFEFNNVTISAPAENFVVRLVYNYNGSGYTKVSDAFTIYYNNMLNVPHDHAVPMAVEFVDSGSLQIITDPPGAHIWVDGADSGRVTPFNFTGLKVGSHACSLLLDGYLPENVSVNVPSEGTARVTKQLKQSTGDVYFNVKPADASIYVNGELAGKGPTNLTKLQYGKYSYTVSREGFRNVTSTFEVLPGEHLPISVELVAVPGLSLTYLGYLIDSMFSAIANIL